MSASQDVHHSAFPFNDTDAKQVDGVAARLDAHEATARYPLGSPAPARAAAAVREAPQEGVHMGASQDVQHGAFPFNDTDADARADVGGGLAAQEAATRDTSGSPGPARAAAAVRKAPQEGVHMGASQDVVQHGAFPFNDTDADALADVGGGLAAQEAATRDTSWSPGPACAAAAVHDAPQKGVDMSAF